MNPPHAIRSPTILARVARASLFTEVRGRQILRSSSPEIASWYIHSTSSGDMIHMLHKKGRRSDHLSTSTLLRKEQEDGPNSTARHQLGERSARLARRFGGGLDLKQHSRSHCGRNLCSLRGQERHHGGWDFWSYRLAPDAAHSLLPRGLCRRTYGKPLWSQARAVGGVAGFSGNDCTGVHRRSTWGCTWGQSRTSAPLSTLKKGQSRFGSRGETLAALAPSYPYQTKLAQAGSDPAPKSLLFLLAVQPASPRCRLSLCRGLSLSGFSPHLIPAPPVVGPLDDVAATFWAPKPNAIAAASATPPSTINNALAVSCTPIPSR